MSTIVGIIAGVSLLFIAIFSKGGIGTFLDPASAAIVLGGTLGAIFTAYPLPRVFRVAKVIGQIFKKDIQQPSWVIAMMVRLSHKARQKSLLSLEEDMRTINNRFIRHGLEMIIDGHPGDLIRDVLMTELELVRSRHRNGASIFVSAAKYAPAFGMIGTLIGLVAMLKSLGGGTEQGANALSGLGDGMAVALITTFYGSMLSNLFFSPMADKLKNRSDDEALSTTIIIEGLIMIQSGMNPRIVEKKLNSYLPPHLRAHHYDKMVKKAKGSAPPPKPVVEDDVDDDFDDFDDDF